MNAATGSTRGRGRTAGTFCRGTALCTASRTSRRCTPNFRATPWIVPIPNSYSRRICSNSSTVAFLRRISPLPTVLLVPGAYAAVAQGGPFPAIKLGQTRVSKTLEAILHAEAVRDPLLDVLGREEGPARRLVPELRLLLRGEVGRAALARLVMGAHGGEAPGPIPGEPGLERPVVHPDHRGAVPETASLAHQPERLQAGTHLGIPLQAVSRAQPRDVVLPVHPQRPSARHGSPSRFVS